ncbi:hypothetical protein [Catenulispora yoronensis]|uniref:hypothetical protein n=1 Tax=Catenulispora yoronensis TaxID=450799 RepID=UPI0031D61442
MEEAAAAEVVGAALLGLDDDDTLAEARPLPLLPLLPALPPLEHPVAAIANAAATPTPTIPAPAPKLRPPRPVVLSGIPAPVPSSSPARNCWRGQSTSAAA